MNTHTAASRPGRFLARFVLCVLAFGATAVPSACASTATTTDAKAPPLTEHDLKQRTRPTVGHIAETDSARAVKGFTAATAKASD